MGCVIGLTQALTMRDECRRVAHTVVFTNGVFDLLHVGHVRYLQAARHQGDSLFVGLNSDTSSQQLKGPGRPLVPEGERAEILAALSCVDYVIIFHELTACNIVASLKPDIYVKGGDYLPGPDAAASKLLPEASIVAQYGGKVILLPYTEGHSTTQLLAAAHQCRIRPPERTNP